MNGQDPNDPNNEIEQLRERLRRHELKIHELGQQLQEDRDSSTKKIKRLEDANKRLEDEKKRLENEVSDLKKKIKQLEDESVGKDARINSIESKLSNVFNRLENVEEELKFFVKKSQGLEKELNTSKTENDSLKKSQNMLFIGELCANLMEAVYREVLPGYFEGDDYKQPHLKAIDAKIEQLCKTKESKREAREKWGKWKAVIGEELVEFMEGKLKLRNGEAHPFPLNENILKEMAKSLPGQEQDHLEKVIELWFTPVYRVHDQVYSVE